MKDIKELLTKRMERRLEGGQEERDRLRAEQEERDRLRASKKKGIA